MKVGKKYKSNYLPVVGECIEVDEENDLLDFKNVSGPWESHFLKDGDTYPFILSKEIGRWIEVEE